jgi:hypothetical protein
LQKGLPARSKTYLRFSGKLVFYGSDKLSQLRDLDARESSAGIVGAWCFPNNIVARALDGMQ